MTSHWGRKESVVWPPHSPIYTYGAALMGLLLMGFFVWCRFSFGQLPLQQFYTPTYLRSAAGAAFEKHDKYALLFVDDGKGVAIWLPRRKRSQGVLRRLAASSFRSRFRPRRSQAAFASCTGDRN